MGSPPDRRRGDARVTVVLSPLVDGGGTNGPLVYPSEHCSVGRRPDTCFFRSFVREFTVKTVGTLP